MGRRRFLTAILALHALEEKRELLAKMLQVNRESRSPSPAADKASNHQMARLLNTRTDIAGVLHYIRWLNCQPCRLNCAPGQLPEGPQALFCFLP